MTEPTDPSDHGDALAHLDEAGLRLEEARATDAKDLAEAELAFGEAMRDYDALRERLFDPSPSDSDGTPVARVWLGRAAVVLRAPGARTDTAAGPRCS
ncbi:hypothetical protein Rumeso_02314 [Rubellimicrobium mesophilum DSM 19309]|uniref:Uncharacterized protein n=1 Tax=Rubellimicrobium mesophilum DSM 19309 TaxID=442562 RepID=A0A017HP96_9RHOB|nr:hypothetical protein [Rubellimicrobium mesophilum]EYD76125.1 hypothetical protein Rumeso_02314 [Rubellimicrobium mesophilum DSM 19309]